MEYGRIKEMLEEQLELIYRKSSEAMAAEDLQRLTVSMCMVADAIRKFYS